MARGVTGMSVSRLDLVRSRGSVQTAFSRSISDQVSPAYHSVLWVTVTLSGLFFMRQFHITWRQIQNIGKSDTEPDVSATTIRDADIDI